jgi:hypothetical protein
MAAEHTHANLDIGHYTAAAATPSLYQETSRAQRIPRQGHETQSVES